MQILKDVVRNALGLGYLELIRDRTCVLRHVTSLSRNVDILLRC